MHLLFFAPFFYYLFITDFNPRIETNAARQNKSLLWKRIRQFVFEQIYQFHLLKPVILCHFEPRRSAPR